MVGIVFEYEKGRDGVVMSYSCAVHMDFGMASGSKESV